MPSSGYFAPSYFPPSYFGPPSAMALGRVERPMIEYPNVASESTIAYADLSDRNRYYSAPVAVTEARRHYLFPGGNLVELAGVVSFQVQLGGYTLLLDAEGTVHYVPNGWICLTIHDPDGSKRVVPPDDDPLTPPVRVVSPQTEPAKPV